MLGHTSGALPAQTSSGLYDAYARNYAGTALDLEQEHRDQETIRKVNREEMETRTPCLRRQEAQEMAKVRHVFSSPSVRALRRYRGDLDSYGLREEVETES